MKKILLLPILLLLPAVSCTQKNKAPNKAPQTKNYHDNATKVICPYKHPTKGWVFDDDRVNLVEEPFVRGADTLIDFMVREQRIPNAEKGCKLIASDKKIP